MAKPRYPKCNVSITLTPGVNTSLALEATERKCENLKTAKSMTHAMRTALVASLAFSADAFLTPGPVSLGPRLQRPEAVTVRDYRFRTGVLQIKASGAMGQRPDPQVTSHHATEDLRNHVNSKYGTYTHCHNILNQRLYVAYVCPLSMITTKTGRRTFKSARFKEIIWGDVHNSHCIKLH